MGTEGSYFEHSIPQPTLTLNQQPRTDYYSDLFASLEEAFELLDCINMMGQAFLARLSIERSDPTM